MSVCRRRSTIELSGRQVWTWGQEVYLMRALNVPTSSQPWRRRIGDPLVTVSLVAAACLLLEAVIAKNVIEVELNLFSQLAPLWIFIAYLVSGLRDRRSEVAFIAVIILATAAVLVLYAF
jgi:hypothetical protein